MGRLDLIKNDSEECETIILEGDMISDHRSIMQMVYENGELLVDDNFEMLKNRAGS